MKLWFGHGSGRDAVFEQVLLPDPTAGEGELLVRVHAAGINRVDLQPRVSHFGHMPPAPGPVPGLEAAGEVVAIGPGVTGFTTGDRVTGMVQGGCAELVRMPHRLALPVPAGWSWESAAAIPVSYLTAHDALVTNGRFRTGQAVLVHAITSGVGLAALQLARLRGASMIAGSSMSPLKLDRLAGFGLDLALTDPYAGFADRLLASTGGRGVDVVVDNIGGRILNETIRATAFGGRIVDVGRLGGVEATLDLNLLALRRASIIGVTFRTRSLDEHAAVVEAFLADHWDDLDSGRLVPLVDRVFPFDRVPDAIEHVASGSRMGKVVVSVREAVPAIRA